jgi:pimeloyl-ACP methyl ester carboxylesterase
MTNISDYFKASQISLAAYGIDLQEGMYGEAYPGYLQKLVSAGFSEIQARLFVNTYTVLSQTNDENGFSATLFLNNITGEKTLAIRGSDDLFDGLTDVVSVAMLGTTTLQQQYQSLKNYYQQLLAQGKIGAGEGITVAGHSLGGFLAQSFAIDYAERVTHTYTYNAPGIGGVVAQVLSALGVVETDITVSSITNIIAQAGPSVTAGLGTMLGEIQQIFIEKQFNPLDNHRMGLLVDALAVYNLLSGLAPAASLDQINALLQKTSATAATTLENLIASLSQTILGADKPQITTDDRESLYSAIKTLTDNPAYQSLTGQLTLSTSLPTVAEARADFGAFLSLIYLTPFTLKAGTLEAQNLLKNAHASLGYQWDADNALTAEQRANGEASYSDFYLADRAAMLSWQNKLNAEDFVDSGFGYLTTGANEDYWEIAS